MSLNDPRPLSVIARHAENESLAAELVATRAELAAVSDERDQYARAMDGLAKQLSNAADNRAAVQLAAGIRAVHAMLRHVTGKVALGQDERPWVDEVKAWLAENGASVYEEVPR